MVANADCQICEKFQNKLGMALEYIQYLEGKLQEANRTSLNLLNSIKIPDIDMKSLNSLSIIS